MILYKVGFLIYTLFYVTQSVWYHRFILPQHVALQACVTAALLYGNCLMRTTYSGNETCLTKRTAY